MLDLTPDELLTTTRAVRKRLDFDRPVDLDVVRECLEIAIQAPTGSNAQGWHWVVVTEPGGASMKAPPVSAAQFLQLFKPSAPIPSWNWPRGHAVHVWLVASVHIPYLPMAHGSPPQ